MFKKKKYKKIALCIFGESRSTVGFFFRKKETTMVEKTNIATFGCFCVLLDKHENSPVVQWSSILASGAGDPGSNPGGTIDLNNQKIKYLRSPDSIDWGT
jgi:hypothetical protein